MNIDEGGFETHIADWLTTKGGYRPAKVGGSDFDADLGLDLIQLFQFVAATQADRWARLVVKYGGDGGSARRAFAARLGKELDSRGTVDVLRHGVTDLGVAFKLAFFKATLRMSYY